MSPEQLARAAWRLALARLYDPLAEEWVVVTIDDRLPFSKRPGRYGNLCFAKPTKENEFWTCLLEKAVAKFVKSYHRLDGGFECVAMEMLTGKPSLCQGCSQKEVGINYFVSWATYWLKQSFSFYIQQLQVCSSGHCSEWHAQAVHL